MNYLSSSDEEFETPQFKSGSNFSLFREEQLNPVKPVCDLPPKLDVSFSKQSTRPSVTMPKRSMSVQEFELSLPDQEIKIAKEIDSELCRKKLITLRPDIPQYITDCLETLLEKKNILLNRSLDIEIFMFLSAILQTHSTVHALIIVPSRNITKWLRNFMRESNSVWPENLNEQQRALTQIRNGRTQVLIAFPKGIGSLQLSHFNYIYVLKSELCTTCLPYLRSFKGQCIFHQTPGYFFETPVQCTYFSVVDTETPTVPVFIKCTKNPRKDLENLITKENSEDNELTKIIICPFKKTVDELVAKCKGKILAFNGDGHTSVTNLKNGCFYASTTSCYYSSAVFDEYIFFGFPFSIDHFLSACILGERVYVLFDENLAIKQQNLSHSVGLEPITVKEILNSLFWTGSKFKKEGDLSLIQISDIDATQDGVDFVLQKLVYQDVIEILPFESTNIQMKVLSMIEEMNVSPLFKAILQGSTNKRGIYNINILQICSLQKVTPMDLIQELNKYINLKAIECSYVGHGIFARLLIDMDSNKFDEMHKTMTREVSKHEEDIHNKFNIIYTLLNNTELIPDYLATRLIDSEKIIEIPHDEVDEDKVRNLINSYRKIQWTPRAATKVLLGIPSPASSPAEWSRTSFWGSLSKCKYPEIMKIAQKAIREAIIGN